LLAFNADYIFFPGWELVALAILSILGTMQGNFWDINPFITPRYAHAFAVNIRQSLAVCAPAAIKSHVLLSSAIFLRSVYISIRLTRKTALRCVALRFGTCELLSRR